jgi:uridine phosphorylase
LTLEGILLYNTLYYKRIVFLVAEAEGEKWVVLHVVNNEVEAHLIAGLLKSRGLRCSFQSMRVSQYPVNVDGLGEIRILVPEGELSEGLELLRGMIPGEGRS